MTRRRKKAVHVWKKRKGNKEKRKGTWKCATLHKWVLSNETHATTVHLFFLTTIHHPVLLNPTVPPQSPGGGRATSHRPAAVLQLMRVNSQNAPGVVGITSQLKKRNNVPAVTGWTEKEKEKKKEKAPTKVGWPRHPFVARVVCVCVSIETFWNRIYMPHV